jgi:hypothetical protein
MSGAEQLKLVVEVEDEDDLVILQAEAQSHSAILAPLDGQAAPAQFSPAFVTVKTESGRKIIDVSGQVVQVTPNEEAVVMLDDEAKTKLAGARFSRPKQIVDLDPNKPLWVQYEAMDKATKIKLAKFGGVEARRLILKDRDASLQGLLLNNPGLKESELVSVIKNNLASPALIKRIMERQEYMSSMAIMEALVFSPLTPVAAAAKMVPKISMDAARRLVKGKYREPLKRAARRRVHAKMRGR